MFGGALRSADRAKTRPHFPVLDLPLQRAISLPGAYKLPGDSSFVGDGQQPGASARAVLGHARL
jgi:hypothetical protein